MNSPQHTNNEKRGSGFLTSILRRDPFSNLERTMASGKAPAFSLIELLSVMSIIMVLMSLAVPAINGITKGRALSHAIDKAWSATSYARQTAIATGLPVALILTKNRQGTDPLKSDAFLSLKAQVSSDASGTRVWNWAPSGTWQKLPHGVQILDRANESDAHSFYELTSQPASSSYAILGNSVPKLEGESIADFVFVVFRPDGSVDSPSHVPFMEFKRLHSDVQTSDSALILSRETGRTRMVRYN